MRAPRWRLPQQSAATRPEPGDPADLVLLDRDPYAVSTPEEMRAMPVAATMLAGRWTYSSLHGE